jgi:hypothetical protein
MSVTEVYLDIFCHKHRKFASTPAPSTMRVSRTRGSVFDGTRASISPLPRSKQPSQPVLPTRMLSRHKKQLLLDTTGENQDDGGRKIEESSHDGVVTQERRKSDISPSPAAPLSSRVRDGGGRGLAASSAERPPTIRIFLLMGCRFRSPEGGPLSRSRRGNDDTSRLL